MVELYQCCIVFGRSRKRRDVFKFVSNVMNNDSGRVLVIILDVI